MILNISFSLSTDFAAGYCLVLYLLNRRLSVESFVRSLSVIVVHESFKPFACARPTAHPRVVEAVDTYFNRVKSLFDEVSLGIVDPTAQP
jgi:hypothetical protein